VAVELHLVAIRIFSICITIASALKIYKQNIVIPLKNNKQISLNKNNEKEFDILSEDDMDISISDVEEQSQINIDQSEV
ncbi:17208_t:CDS:2, partial [Racocetra fulgida]